MISILSRFLDTTFETSRMHTAYHGAKSDVGPLGARLESDFDDADIAVHTVDGFQVWHFTAIQYFSDGNLPTVDHCQH